MEIRPHYFVLIMIFKCILSTYIHIVGKSKFMETYKIETGDGSFVI